MFYNNFGVLYYNVGCLFDVLGVFFEVMDILCKVGYLDVLIEGNFVCVLIELGCFGEVFLLVEYVLKLLLWVFDSMLCVMIVFFGVLVWCVIGDIYCCESLFRQVCEIFKFMFLQEKGVILNL